MIEGDWQMNDTQYTLYRLAVTLTMPPSNERNVRMAGITYRLAMNTQLFVARDSQSTRENNSQKLSQNG